VAVEGYLKLKACCQVKRGTAAARPAAPLQQRTRRPVSAALNLLAVFDLFHYSWGPMQNLEQAVSAIWKGGLATS